MKKPFLINESVSLGGLQQAVQIRGTDPENPLLLMIHGGPGCSEMGVCVSYQKPWLDRYTVVNWDQRYVGATALLSGATPERDFALDDIVEDAHELSLYLLKKYGREKLVILGHSWGSVVGSQLASRYPELFYGFIGWGQVVNMVKNEKVSIAHTRQLALKENDQETIKKLDALMPYPDPKDSTDEMMQKLMASTSIKYYYGYGSLKFQNLTDYTDYLITLAKGNPDYPDEAIPFMDNSLAYTEVFCRDVFHFDLLEASPKYKIPVLFVFGDNDWQTPFSLGKEYLEKLEAPYKSFYLIPKSGHSTTLDNPDGFTDYLIHNAYSAIMESR